MRSITARGAIMSVTVDRAVISRDGELGWYSRKAAAMPEAQPAIVVYGMKEDGYKAKWEQCADFLESLLSKTALPAVKATEAAKLAGFKPAIIRQVKMRLGIVSRYRGAPGNAGVWWWEMPTDEAAEEEEYIPDPAMLASIRRKLMRR